MSAGFLSWKIRPQFLFSMSSRCGSMFDATMGRFEAMASMTTFGIPSSREVVVMSNALSSSQNLSLPFLEPHIFTMSCRLYFAICFCRSGIDCPSPTMAYFRFFCRKISFVWLTASIAM